MQEVIGVADLTDYASKSGSGTAALGATITSPTVDDKLVWDGSAWVNRGFNEVDARSCTGGTIVGCVTDIGGTNKRTVVISDTRSYGSSTTVSSNIALKFTGAGLIDCNNTASAVTINRPIVAPEGQTIFTNCGTNGIFLSGNKFLSEIYPNWWGGSSSLSDNTTATATFIKLTNCVGCTIAGTTFEG